MAQILYRNDTEADCSTQELIDWDAAIIEEDRDALESTDPDAPIDVALKAERSRLERAGSFGRCSLS